MKKYLDIILINLGFLIIGITAYFCLNEKVEILTACLAIGISMSFGIRQYKIENDKMFKELFQEFNHKYDTKFNETLNAIADNTKSNPDYELTPEHQKLVIDYLNFCAEEYLWHRKGRIDKEVWSSWKNGMTYFLRIEPIKKVIVAEQGQKDSYYGLFKEIGVLIGLRT